MTLRIEDRELTIQITDPVLIAGFSSFNRNGDDTINIDDIKGNQTVEEKRDLFHLAVAKVLVKADVISASQREAMARFFNLYNDVKTLSRAVEGWKVNHKDRWGLELEFSPDYWEAEVLPHLVGNGALRSDGAMILAQGELSGYHLSNEIFEVYSALTETKPPKDSIVGPCDHHIASLTYSINAIPNLIAPQVAELTTLYQGVEAFLRGYSDIECDAWWGCPEPDEFGLFLIKLGAAQETSFGKGYCFTPSF